MKKRIYISLPMGGYEDTVMGRFEKASREVLHKLGDVEIIAPYDIDMFDKSEICNTPSENHDWAWYMGRDLEIILRCDAIFMCRGYLNSQGCRVELAVAREMSLEIFFADDAQKDII